MVKRAGLGTTDLHFGAFDASKCVVEQVVTSSRAFAIMAEEVDEKDEDVTDSSLLSAFETKLCTVNL